MEQYSGNRRQHLFDFDWYFTRELPRLKDRYTGAHYTYKTTKAGQRCPYALDGWDVSGWRKLDLPHDWLVEVPFDEAALSAQGHVRRGTAWYRKQFLLEESCRDKQILLNFDGIAGGGGNLSERLADSAAFQQLYPHYRRCDGPGFHGCAQHAGDFCRQRRY